MGDRIFPGSGINSFLHDNGILRGLISSSGSVAQNDELKPTIELNRVATFENENKEVKTVPVTEADKTNVVQKATNSVDIVDEPIKYAASDNMSEIAKNVAENAESKVAETYCPYKDGRCRYKQMNNVGDVTEHYFYKDAFRARNKAKLEGANDESQKQEQKGPIETFCNENWHTIAISIIITIVLVAITLSIMMFTGLIKVSSNKEKMKGGYVTNKSFDENYDDYTNDFESFDDCPTCTNCPTCEKRSETCETCETCGTCNLTGTIF